MQNEVLIISVMVDFEEERLAGQAKLSAALNQDFTLMSTTSATQGGGEVVAIYTFAKQIWNPDGFIPRNPGKLGIG